MGPHPWGLQDRLPDPLHCAGGGGGGASAGGGAGFRPGASRVRPGALTEVLPQSRNTWAQEAHPVTMAGSLQPRACEGVVPLHVPPARCFRGSRLASWTLVARRRSGGGQLGGLALRRPAGSEAPLPERAFLGSKRPQSHPRRSGLCSFGVEEEKTPPFFPAWGWGFTFCVRKLPTHFTGLILHASPLHPTLARASS